MGWGDRVPAAPPRRRRRFGSILWALLPLLTWGLLAPVPFVHAAIRLRTAGMWAVAAAYVIAWAVVGPAGILAQDPDLDVDVAAFSQLGLVVAATANAFMLRGRVFPPPSVDDPAVAAALAARARWRRSRAASAAATAGSPTLGGGNTRPRSMNALAVAATTSPSWEKPATASSRSGSWTRMPAGPTTAQAMT